MSEQEQENRAAEVEGREAVPVLLTFPDDAELAALMASNKLCWERHGEVKTAVVTYVNRDHGDQKIHKIVHIRVSFDPRFEVV